VAIHIVLILARTKILHDTLMHQYDFRAEIMAAIVLIFNDPSANLGVESLDYTPHDPRFQKLLLASGRV
jgi:hypothetical protein